MTPAELEAIRERDAEDWATPFVGTDTQSRRADRHRLLAYVAALQQQRRDWLDNDLTARTMIGYEKELTELRALLRESRHALEAGSKSIIEQHQHEETPSMDEYVENQREYAAQLRALSKAAE